ncbi:MAG: hypothetical protein COV52_02325 [Gammaproteobacteria bacterium CG11_big_fil_rev_8_21_14_0_20_46_22]|nr:MAG: hypothetical protein COW05_01320 [Gammaproteobacteria bacterium CG12_big_fil_rev_8_21_14_0_65_46_12]PIR11766.1 MAG: hypothetical protein COV52_02325 [Gammaproteobacteria bacterium CG11_big_fil_rev_8_21_14_0_20_46_22]
MIARRFAQYLLKSRLHAVMLAVIFAIVPFFSWVSAVIVALVTLRKGIREGFLVLMWSLLPAVVTMVVAHQWLFGVHAIFGSALAWLLASVFLRRPNWRDLIILATFIAVIAVLLFHWLMPDAHAWWVSLLKGNAKPIEGTLKMTAQEESRVAEAADRLAYFAVGLNAAYLALSTLVELWFARIVDKLLPKPVQADTEKTELRMPFWFAALAVLVVLGATFKLRWLYDYLPLVGLPFFVAGLSGLVRFLLKRFSPLTVLFIFIVLFIVIMFIPVIAASIAVYALLDSLIDLRRFKAGK